MNYGTLLKLHRDTLGLTQEETAQRCKLTKATICGIEQGQKKNPKLTTLLKIFRGLGVNPFSRQNAGGTK